MVIRVKLPTKEWFVENLLSLPMVECVVKRDVCALAYREDHERYCYANDFPHRIVDMVDCPLKISRRKYDNTKTD